VADDLDPAAVERAVQAWAEVYGIDPSLIAESDSRAIRAALAAAGPLVTTVSADSAAVIAAEEERIKGYVDFDEHRDQAVGEINGMRRALRLLAAAGLLVTPEHDAQVAARASFSAWHHGWAAGWKDHQRRTDDLDAYAQEGSTPNPYRIERQDVTR